MKPAYSAVRASSLETNLKPSPENFKIWQEAFRPELANLTQKAIWILYIAAWCNGVSEERAFDHEKIYSQGPQEDSSHTCDAA